MKALTKYIQCNVQSMIVKYNMKPTWHCEIDWRRYGESNPGLQFWRLPLYH